MGFPETAIHPLNLLILISLSHNGLLVWNKRCGKKQNWCRL